MRAIWSRYRWDILILAAFWLLPMLLFGDVTLGGRTMLPADNLFQWEPWRPYAAQFGVETPQNSLLSDLILQNYAWKQFIRESLAQGELPLWNPLLFAGQPFLANGQHSAYYPFSLLFLLLPLSTAYGWFTVSQLWLAGVSAYLFGRLLGLRPSSAALTGLIYQGAGFLLVSAAVFPMILAGAVWLPLLLGCSERVIGRVASPQGAGRTLPWAVLGAAGLGLNVLAGHPEITYYTLLIMAAYAAWRLTAVWRRERFAWQRPLRAGGWLIAMVAVGLLLGAVQLLPAFTLAGTNFRQGAATLAEVRSWAFPPRQVLTLALPNFYGNPSHHSYIDAFTLERVPFTVNWYGEPNPHGANSSSWGIKNYVEGGVYLGILPLALAGLGVWSLGRRSAADGGARRSSGSFLTALSICSLAFIFGTPLYAVLYYGLPFINQLHSPFRWVFGLSVGVAALAGFGADYLADRARSAGAARLAEAALWLLGAGALGGALLGRLAYGRLEPLFTRIFLDLAQAPDAFPSTRAFFSYVLPQALVLGVVAILAALTLRLARRNCRWPLAAFALIAIDLWLPNHSFHTAVDPALLTFRPQAVAWLQEQPGLWRITTFAPKDKAFNANAGWLFGLQDVRGYDSIIDRRYVAYMEAIEPQTELPFNRIQPVKDWQALNSPLLDLLNVRYILTTESLDLPKLNQVWAGEGVRIYENLAVMPRAYTLPQTAAFPSTADFGLAEAARQRDLRTVLLLEGAPLPATPPQPATPVAATVARYGNLEVWVDAAVAEPGWLVLADSYAVGWRAFVRPRGAPDTAEQEAPVYAANGNFRAVPLSTPGDYTVRFRYSPRSFIGGALATFMGGAIIALATGVWAWRQFYRPRDALTNTQSIAKNSVVPMALNLFNKGIDFAFAAFYLRVLGPGEAGAYATAITIALWFEIVSNWGLNALLIREVAQDRAQAGRYLFNTSLLRLFTVGLGVLPVALFVGEGVLSGDPMGRDTLLAIGLLMVGMVFSGLGQGVAGLFYAFEQAEYPAALTSITTILKVAFGVIALLLGWGFVGLAAVSILVNLITLLLLGLVAARQFPLHGSLRPDWALQRRAFRIGYPLMLNHLLATVFFKIDQPLLYRLVGDAQVGWYNSAYKWVDAFNIIPSFFTFALFPIISRQVLNNIEDAQRTFRMAVKLLVLTALPLAAVVTLSADLMIGVLGGREFLPAGALALRLVIWSIPIGWINSVTNYTIVALGMERRLTLGFVVGVLFNLIGNLLFIPRYGFVAAAVTTILSELLLLLVFSFYLHQRLPRIGWAQLLGRPMLATAVMGGGLWIGTQAHLALGLALGLALYPAALWALGVFGSEERQVAAKLLPGRFGRWVAPSTRPE